MRNKTYAGMSLLAVLLLAGCAAPAPQGADGGDAPAPEETTEQESAEVVVGEPAPPGARVGIDEWVSFPFTSSDDVEAIISAKLVSIEPVTAEEQAVLDENFGDQIADYDLYLVRAVERKESGGTIAFSADYTSYRVVDADGERVQEVSLIGWEGCDQQSFTEEFDAGGVELDQCWVGAVPTGDPAPAGLAFVGGFEDDNPYDMVDGEPVYLLAD